MTRPDTRAAAEAAQSSAGETSIRLEAVRAIAGPNVYHHRPVLVATLDLGELSERPTSAFPHLKEALLDLLPGLGEHHCSRGRPGGFVERLAEGTYLGHVTEHVALELQALTGSRVTYGKTVYAGKPGLYRVVVRYESEAAMRYLLAAAVDLVNALLRREPFDISVRVEEAKRIIARTELGPSTRSIVDAATRRGIPWRRLDEHSLIQLGYGRHRKLIRAALSEGTSHIGVETAGDKELTKRLLREAGIPVPRAIEVESVDEAVGALAELGAPVVVKPLDGNQGRGVSLDVDSPEAVRRAFKVAVEHSPTVLVEEQLAGNDYRVLVVGGRVVAASQRLACHVVGDGVHSVEELIERANLDPRRGEGHEKPLTRIEIDEIVTQTLARNGLSLDYIPPRGEPVVLNRCANLSKGATARDVTDDLHPSVRRACERAARIVGLDICGVDLVCSSIDRPFTQGGIVELNASPGLRMHLSPSEGKSRDVGSAIVDMLFPVGTPSRVPILAVTGTNGKTTVARLVGHVISASNATVGMTTTDGIYVAGELTVPGDNTGPASARTVLSDPTVDVAVLECARGGLLRRGLGYDWSDVAIITNIREDHIGQDGIEDIEDLVWIKSLVAERVREGGTLILNADDEEAARLPQSPRLQGGDRRLVYYSLDPSNPIVRRHIATGGTAYVFQYPWLTELKGKTSRTRIALVGAIPMTLGGAAGFQVQNCLAAIAACRAYGLDRETIARALGTFASSEHNPGRVNLYRVGSGYVMLDYGHNPDALEAAARLAGTWGRPTTAIVGVPGDRDDRIIQNAARIAARGFDRLVIREDKDLRGRNPGEVAELLRWTALSENPRLDCRIVLDERDALEAELATAISGGLLVVFYEHLQPLVDLLVRHGAQTAEEAEIDRARAS